MTRMAECVRHELFDWLAKNSENCIELTPVWPKDDAALSVHA